MQEDSYDDLMMSPGAVAGAPSPGATGHDERDEPQAAASVARDAPTRPAIERRGIDDKVVLTAWRPTDPAVALGLAVEYLSRKPAFAALPFGEWSLVLFYQVARGHFFFVVDPDRGVQGFLGWAVTSRALAEQWVEGRAGLRDDECREGDCVIVNAFAAETRAANRFLVDAIRNLIANKRTLYFKRHYRDGRTRPTRLNVNDFVAGHLARNVDRRNMDGGVQAERRVQEDQYDDPVTSRASVAGAPTPEATGHNERDAPLLLRHGVEALQTNDVNAAIEHLNRVVALDPNDLQGQLQFGVALQAAGRHAEALEHLTVAQASPTDDPAPFLRAAVSHLAIGDDHAALVAASEACWRAPKLAAAHYAYGQAWAATGEHARAEEAFAAAIHLNPRWADAWVNYGLARYRLGAVEDAKTAMRQALIGEPGHAAALANLGAFMRISGESEGAERLLRERASARQRISERASIWRPNFCKRSARPRRWLSWTARSRRATRRRRAIGGFSEPWRWCSSAARRRRELSSTSLRHSGRFHRRLCPSCTGGECCWRSPKAMPHAPRMKPRGWNEPSRTWARRPFQSTRSWRASISPSFSPGRAR